MKPNEPFELSYYVLESGAMFSNAAVLGIETLRYNTNGLYYADMNVTLSTNGDYKLRNPISYKVLLETPSNMVLFDDVLDASSRFYAIHGVPHGLFAVRRADGMFLARPDFVRGRELMYAYPYKDKIDEREKNFADRYHEFGRYQLGTQEYVIQTLMQKMRGVMWPRVRIYNVMKKILDERKIVGANGR